MNAWQRVCLPFHIVPYSWSSIRHANEPISAHCSVFTSPCYHHRLAAWIWFVCKGSQKSSRNELFLPLVRVSCYTHKTSDGIAAATTNTHIWSTSLYNRQPSLSVRNIEKSIVKSLSVCSSLNLGRKGEYCMLFIVNWYQLVEADGCLHSELHGVWCGYVAQCHLQNTLIACIMSN